MFLTGRVPGRAFAYPDDLRGEGSRVDFLRSERQVRAHERRELAAAEVGFDEGASDVRPPRSSGGEIRSQRLYSHSVVMIGGVQKTVAEWCKATGVPLVSALRRVLNGVPVELAVQLPRDEENRRDGSGRGTRFQVGDQSLTTYEWAKVTGIAYHTLRRRLLQGMTMEEAIHRPWDRRVTGGESTIYYAVGGQKRTLTQWCEHFDKPYTVVRMRLRRGMSIEDALAKPVRQHKRRP